MDRKRKSDSIELEGTSLAKTYTIKNSPLFIMALGMAHQCRGIIKKLSHIIDFLCNVKHNMACRWSLK